MTWPESAYKKTETMPSDASQWYYECQACHALLRPKLGDCCVFCPYGSVRCPPMREAGRDYCC
ncbi:GDCCVxC domain-containing (seleno)protein [Thioalkalivibrio nitratireducens]|uniref:GDCCVxC domain-containing (seleno)protein n=1 Tax=Thioalkalivibrio nitratireducens TaxID=186931 RepID=UPI0009F9A06B|nr:GDCCVxC domain-containing (seleno)protein [Thioalkalivibrio nitratireducens]